MEKEYYAISGHTTSYKYVVTGPWDTQEDCISCFKKKYPRFKGKATLYIEICRTFGSDIVFQCRAHNDIKVLKQFTNNKEI